MDMKKRIKSLLFFMSNCLDKILKNRDDVFIQNYSLSPLGAKQKRVLISYITASFTKPSKSFYKHTNIWDSMLLIKYFVDKGFVIDIINFNSKYINQIDNDYDIVLGFGEAFQFAKKKYINAIKILYLTEAPPSFVTLSYKSRIDYYKERHNKIPYCVNRQGVYTDNQLLNNDFMITLGNMYNWNNVKCDQSCVYSIYPSSFINSDYKFNDKINHKKSGFLWFGSHGLIHKGLDLILDVFIDEPNLNLHISGANKKELKSIYNYDQSNIKVYDFIDVSSNEFLELIEEVTWIIFPSCSEAASTSVLTCMNHGLIPIISKECAIDISDDIGFYFDGYKLDDIHKMIQSVVNLSDETITKMSRQAIEFARANSSRQSYLESVTKILDEILQIN